MSTSVKSVAGARSVRSATGPDPLAAAAAAAAAVATTARPSPLHATRLRRRMPAARGRPFAAAPNRLSRMLMAQGQPRRSQTRVWHHLKPTRLPLRPRTRRSLRPSPSPSPAADRRLAADGAPAGEVAAAAVAAAHHRAVAAHRVAAAAAAAAAAGATAVGRAVTVPAAAAAAAAAGVAAGAGAALRRTRGADRGPALCRRRAPPRHLGRLRRPPPADRRCSVVCWWSVCMVK